jgi:hypothetical protein
MYMSTNFLLGRGTLAEDSAARVSECKKGSDRNAPWTCRNWRRLDIMAVTNG